MAQEPLYKSLSKLDQWIISIGHKISLVFLLISLIIIGEIIARYIFNSPTMWVHETTIFLSSLLFLYGGIHSLASNKHIRITMIYDTLSVRQKYFADIFISIMGIVYSTLMVIAAFVVAKSAMFMPWGAFHLETSGSAWDPPIPGLVKAFLLIILLIMLIQYILHLCILIKRKNND